MKTLNHIAIIADGNRRWARKHRLPTFEGHRQGFNITMKLIRKAQELDIKVLTFWFFSTENWNRSKEEVAYLMKLCETMADKTLRDALKNKIRIVHLGRKDRLNDKLRQKILNAETNTEKFNQHYLCIALDYGGRDEVLRAVKKIDNSKFKIKDLSEENFNQFLDTKLLPYPNPDLVIRTSGEYRTSGFMIWQAAYSEYIFIDKYFPDFTPQDLEKCIFEYQKRQRRFGK